MPDRIGFAGFIYCSARNEAFELRNAGEKVPVEVAHFHQLEARMCGSVVLEQTVQALVQLRHLIGRYDP